MSPRTRVAVIFGGRSTEHAISCVSAGAILAALDPARYEVHAVGITRSGRWVLENTDPARFAARAGSLPEVDPAGAPVHPRIDPTRPVLLVDPAVGSGAAAHEIAVDVVIPVLHGPWGEDGTVQGLLETAGLPYVGSGVLASAAGMDKAAMKRLLAAAGLPVGAWTPVTAAGWTEDPVGVTERVVALGLPVFVKPARAGSSLGIAKVKKVEDLPAAVAAALEHDPRLVVEAGIEDVREIECGVLVHADGVARASVCGEIVVHGAHEFYDFEAKYLDDSADLVVPADLDDEVSDRVRAAAVTAFHALGCEGLARVDFFLDRAGSLLVNEVNTMPGFTPISMFPRMWAATGTDYPAIVDTLVRDALSRGSGLRA